MGGRRERIIGFEGRIERASGDKRSERGSGREMDGDGERRRGM